MLSDIRVGSRIRLIEMRSERYPVEPGTLGTVQYIDGIGNVLMKWDNGRTLSLLPDVDLYEIVG